MDASFLKEQAARCRSLAERADEFTKRRLLDLATKYDGELIRPSRASRYHGADVVEALVIGAVYTRAEGEGK